MGDSKRRSWEAVLFWVGGCAASALPPLLSAYVFDDFVPQAKGRTPIEDALMRAQLGGLVMLIPAMVFQYGQARQERNAFLERRPMAAGLALLFGLATPSLANLAPQDGLMPLVVFIAVPLASSRLMFSAAK